MATQKVRYVSSDIGIIVRDAPGGSYVTGLVYGDLMYERSTNYQTIEGEDYTWAYVYYYKNDHSEGTGWVAIENTTVVSTTPPSKSNVISNAGSLKPFEQLINARYIYHYLKNKGWRDYPIFAVLGNMEIESSINPGKWQVPNDTSEGYGLVQWDDATKLITWANENNLDYRDMDTQIKRILYEVEAGIQWDKTKDSPEITFSEFTTSTKSVYDLAEYFVRCYEIPADVNNKVATRQKLAWKWCTLIGYLNA